MGTGTAKRDVAVSMRLRDEDLALIDRGAALTGLSRTEFVRRAALRNAEAAILDEALVRLSPEGFQHFREALEAPPAEAPAKVLERLARPAPWSRDGH